MKEREAKQEDEIVGLRREVKQGEARGIDSCILSISIFLFESSSYKNLKMQTSIYKLSMSARIIANAHLVVG